MKNISIKFIAIVFAICAASQRTEAAWYNPISWFYAKDEPANVTAKSSTVALATAKSTEKSIEYVACREYRCEDTGKCIFHSQVCDGIAHCDNGEDEMHCVYDCEPDSFVCSKPYLDNHTCIPPDMVCNRKKDCPDGEDENQESCDAKLCPADWFRCADKRKCIDTAYVCDTVPNCLDGSDERNCSYPKGGEPCFEWLPCFEYRQNVPHCYDPKTACDGKNDCSNGLDESNCQSPSGNKNPTNLHVSLKQFDAFTSSPPAENDEGSSRLVIIIISCVGAFVFLALIAVIIVVFRHKIKSQNAPTINISGSRSQSTYQDAGQIDSVEVKMFQDSDQEKCNSGVGEILRRDDTITSLI